MRLSRPGLVAAGLLVASCAPPPPDYSITPGTDGNFRITLSAEGPAARCRAEVLRLAREESARRGMPGGVIDDTGMAVTAARGRCTAELTVSTLGAWPR
ncbi:hypothetical protein C8P66_103129 [Humitalea rosea]|uniref:Lipoprotein n=1 Tax=Humitalea rosea TaxID=990373 RepID=A0A2W7ITB2_9PROT|nr:hypothetical protein [Humitalea rosea]PZW49103.1 hypothetical protein C8P66_103129 [Humitalea rosea]